MGYRLSFWLIRPPFYFVIHVLLISSLTMSKSGIWYGILKCKSYHFIPLYFGMTHYEYCQYNQLYCRSGVVAKVLKWIIFCARTINNLCVYLRAYVLDCAQFLFKIRCKLLSQFICKFLLHFWLELLHQGQFEVTLTTLCMFSSSSEQFQ